MTAYEKADLFATLIDSATYAMMCYITVLFAFLIASYVIAPNLDRKLSGITIGLFSLFSVIMILAVNRTLATVAGLAETMRRESVGGNIELSWHPAVAEPFNMAQVGTPIATILLITSTIGAIYFFIQMRKRNVGNNKPAQDNQ